MAVPAEVVGQEAREPAWLDRRVGLALVAAWTAVLCFSVAELRPWEPTMPLRNDFVSFWTGAQLLRDGAGASLFDMRTQAGFQADLRRSLIGNPEMRPGVVLDPFHSPPAQGLLLIPLTLLPVGYAHALWWVLSLAGFLVAVSLPLKGAPWPRTGAAFLLASAPVADTLLFGQVNVLFALGLSTGMYALAKRREVLGGALLGILWLKPQYALPFAAVLLLKRRWREAAGMAASGLVVGTTSLWAIGLDGVTLYIRVLQRIGGLSAPADSYIFPQAMVNWRAVVVHLVPGIPEDLGTSGMTALAVATVVAALGVWRGTWDPSSPRFARQMLVLTVAAILASPHSNFHGLTLLLGPMAFTLARPAEPAPNNRLFMALALAGYAATWVIWPTKSWSWLLVPYLIAVCAVLAWQIEWCRRWPEKGT